MGGVCLGSSPSSKDATMLPSAPIARTPTGETKALSVGCCLPKKHSWQGAFLQPGALLRAPHYSAERLCVSVLGGGPVGLFLALRLAESSGDFCVHVTVYDWRWARGPDGKLEWLGDLDGEDWFEETPVVTLPDDVVEPKSTGGLSDRSLSAFDGERVWPHSRNVGIGRLREQLLQRAQAVDVADSITLDGLPTGHHEAMEEEPSEVAVATCRGWIETLDSSLVVAADGPVGDLARRAYAVELGWTPLITWHDQVVEKVTSHVLDLIVEDGEVPHQRRLLTTALSGAQTRYFYNPDAKSGRAHLCVKLSEDESKHVAQTFVRTHGSCSPCSRCMLYRRGSTDCEVSQFSRLYELVPSLQKVLEQGLALFGLSENRVVTVAFVATKPKSYIQTFVGNSSGGSKIFSVVEDSTAYEQVLPPPQQPVGSHSSALPRRSSRGVAAGLEAAEALALVLHVDAPPNVFECFMQGRRYAAGSSGWADLCKGVPADESRAHCTSSRQQFVDSLYAWCAELQKDPMHLAAPMPLIEVTLDRAGLYQGSPACTSLCSGMISLSIVSPVESLAALRAGSEASPGVAFVKALQARAALEEGMPRKALALLRRPRVQSSSYDLLGAVVRAEAHARTGNLNAAWRACEEALRADAEGVSALAVRAEVNLHMGYFVDAIQDCETVLARDRNCFVAYALRAQARLRLDRAEEAITDCDWAIAHGFRTGAVLSVRGEAHWKLGKRKEAICDCDEALREDPRCIEALGTRGRAFLEQGEFSAAVDDLSRAIEATRASASKPAGPSNSVAGIGAANKMDLLLVARAEAFVELRNFDDAVTDCDDALALQGQGDMALARAVRGEAHLLSGRLREAFTDCDVALKMEPTDAYTFAVRAQVKLLLGRRWEALEDCDRALGLCPKLEFAVNIRDQVGKAPAVKAR
mmetsp:Transcript_102725/g.257560  ORF Transcript_102725/g.257560 Transcript_102725/m.257560 type:complete len:922 (-) Transcript_102725:175-2940(-)